MINFCVAALLPTSLDVVEESPKFLRRQLDGLAAVQLFDARLHVLTELGLPPLQFAKNLQARRDDFLLGPVFAAGELLLNELCEIRWNNTGHRRGLPSLEKLSLSR